MPYTCEHNIHNLCDSFLMEYTSNTCSLLSHTPEGREKKVQPQTCSNVTLSQGTLSIVTIGRWGEKTVGWMRQIHWPDTWWPFVRWWCWWRWWWWWWWWWWCRCPMMQTAITLKELTSLLIGVADMGWDRVLIRQDMKKEDDEIMTRKKGWNMRRCDLICESMIRGMIHSVQRVHSYSICLCFPDVSHSHLDQHVVPTSCLPLLFFECRMCLLCVSYPFPHPLFSSDQLPIRFTRLVFMLTTAKLMCLPNGKQIQQPHEASAASFQLSISSMCHVFYETLYLFIHTPW